MPSAKRGIGRQLPLEFPALAARVGLWKQPQFLPPLRRLSLSPQRKDAAAWYFRSRSTVALSPAEVAAPKSMIRTFLSLYSQASIRWALPVAFATCYLKGAASDLVAQKVVEKKETINWRRNFAFATFSGAYLGCGQHYVYNVAFTQLFGAATTPLVAFQKVVADALVHVPMIYLPLYYMCENTFLGGSPEQGLVKYQDEAWDTLSAYWKLWTFFHFANFTFTPVEFRIATIACVSFIWLIILSFMSHQDLSDDPSGGYGGAAEGTKNQKR